MIALREFVKTDIAEATAIWNKVVEDGVAFPQTDTLNNISGKSFFEAQSYTGIAEDSENGEIKGLYILHPNNVGRCAHICNASFAVKANCRGQHIGEALVTDCLKKAKELNFRIIQFNAVVKSNLPALHLYEKLGFTRLGTVPGGFKLTNDKYSDIVLFYKTL